MAGTGRYVYTEADGGCSSGTIVHTGEKSRVDFLLFAILEPGTLHRSFDTNRSMEYFQSVMGALA